MEMTVTTTARLRAPESTISSVLKRAGIDPHRQFSPTEALRAVHLGAWQVMLLASFSDNGETVNLYEMADRTWYVCQFVGDDPLTADRAEIRRECSPQRARRMFDNSCIELSAGIGLANPQ